MIKNMIREFRKLKNMIKKYDKVFSEFQNMIKMNMIKNIQFLKCDKKEN